MIGALACAVVCGVFSAPVVLEMSKSVAPGTARLLNGRPKLSITGTPEPGATVTPASDGAVSTSSDGMPGQVTSDWAKQLSVAAAPGWQSVCPTCSAKMAAGLK